jgi:hypothetical protein
MAIFLIMMILLLLVIVLLQVAKLVKADFYAAETVSSEPGKTAPYSALIHPLPRTLYSLVQTL